MPLILHCRGTALRFSLWFTFRHDSYFAWGFHFLLLGSSSPPQTCNSSRDASVWIPACFLNHGNSNVSVNFPFFSIPHGRARRNIKAHVTLDEFSAPPNPTLYVYLTWEELCRALRYRKPVFLFVLYLGSRESNHQINWFWNTNNAQHLNNHRNTWKKSTKDEETSHSLL